MAKKVVKEVLEPPLCISPLTVAVRTLGDLEKLRLCLDLSRYINTLLQKEAVKLSGIDKCTQNLLPGDYIATYDLTSAFHHIRIFEEHQQYLGFALPGRDGKKERYFVFLVMPFGLASAVKCITRITKPLCGYFAKNGVRHSIYIDDGNVLARTLALVIAHLDFVLNALKQAGFVISAEKTDDVDSVSQVKVYLGFVVDSTSMTLSISPQKLQDLRQALQVVTQTEGQLRAKTLAKAIGKLVAAEPALGPVVQLLSRTAQSELASSTEARGWNAWMRVSEQAKEGLRIMDSRLEEYNGYPIKNLATAKRLDSVLRPSRETEGKDMPTQLLRIQDTTCRVIAGDASAVATCALEIGDEAKFFTQNKLSEEEMRLSSGHRELLTVLRALQQEEGFFKTLAHKTIIWLTDSTNLVSFLTKGTMKQHIQAQVLEVFELLAKYQIRAVPVHLRRTDYRIQWADEGSREFDPDDWGIDQASYRALTKEWLSLIHI